MKVIFQIIFIGALISNLGCSQSNKKTANGQTTEWKKLKCGLYLSPEGVLGFASDPEIANISSSELESERCPNVFLTTIGSEHKVTLSSVIDTNTFEAIGAAFYKDKSNIYNYYAMCDGGYLNIFANDTTDFKILGSCYASYKNKIYHSRNGLVNADASSFRTSSAIGPYAKDKNGYFSSEERVSE